MAYAASLVHSGGASAEPLLSASGSVTPEHSLFTGSRKRLRVSMTPQGVASQPATAEDLGPGSGPDCGPPELVPDSLLSELYAAVGELSGTVKSLSQEACEQQEATPQGLLPPPVLVSQCEQCGLVPPARLTEETVDNFIVDAAQRMLDLAESTLEIRAPEPADGSPVDAKFHRWAFRPADPDKWVFFKAGTGAYDKEDGRTVANGKLKPITPSPAYLISVGEADEPPIVRDFAVGRDLRDYPSEMKSVYSAARTASGLRRYTSLAPPPPPPLPSVGRLPAAVDKLAAIVGRLSLGDAPPPLVDSEPALRGRSVAEPQVVRAYTLRAAAAPPRDCAPQAVLAQVPTAPPAALANPSDPEAAPHTPATKSDTVGVAAGSPPPTSETGGDVSWGDIQGLPGGLSWDDLVAALADEW